MNLAVIVPALNEEASIATTLARLPRDLVRQLIVVDNGSTDRTAEVARAAGALVVAEPRRGYGRACLAGLARLEPTIDTVAIVDADGADDTDRLAELCAVVAEQGADLVVTARVLGDARRNLSVPQRFGNWLACFLIGLGWGRRFRDLGPMRVAQRAAFESLGMQDPTWGWNVEMQVKAIERGLRIREVPVAYGRRAAGRSKISGSLVGTVRAGTKILTTLGRLWWARRRARRP